MPTAENARLQMETGQLLVPLDELTDSGDQTTFTSPDTLWSDAAGFEAVIIPNGVRTGAVITPDDTNNQVNISAWTANLNGDDEAFGAATTAFVVTRPTGATDVIKNSIVITSTGGFDEVTGTASAAFSNTRGAAGGPPLIPVDAIEIGQVWLEGSTAALITTSEIKQVVGAHREVYNYPLWDVKLYGGKIVFIFALNADHTGGLAKKVFAEYSTPFFANIQKANNVKPPEETFSVTSTPSYDGPVASATKALGQGSFEAKVQDGINDLIVTQKGKKLWFKFYPNKFKGDHVLFQGFLGVSRTFPADGALSASCTISSESTSVDVPA